MIRILNWPKPYIRNQGMLTMTCIFMSLRSFKWMLISDFRTIDKILRLR